MTDMIELNRHYVDGAWHPVLEPQAFPIMNPAEDSPVGTVTLGGPADADRAVAAAKRAFSSFSESSREERLTLLRRLRDIMRARNDEMGAAISREMGAPITMARAEQAACGIGYVEDYISILEVLPEEEILKNGDVIHREPIGVCGLITPWNWPINQIAQKVLPALAVGATCVLKPSEHTPLSAALFAEMVHEAGYPAGVFNLVFGEGATVGSALSRHPDIAMMSFTGSTRAGALVSKDAADSIKRVTLELGGKSANLVFADCDLETRVTASVQACFHNTGQSCNAPTRLLVERSCLDQVLEIAKRTTTEQRVGDPAQEGDHIGPLFDRMQYDRVQAMIQVGIKEGARLMAGGLGRPEGLDRGAYVRPTLFADVHNQMRIAQEEIFGPVLVVIPFDSEEEAIEIANDSPYGLAAYIQTGSASRAARVASKLRTGTILINGNGPNYGSPFGGYKQSGNGREGGHFGLDEYLEIKVMPSLEKLLAAEVFSAD